jgi:hypothetical protein
MAGVQVSPQGPDATSGVSFFGQAGLLTHRYTSDQYEGGTDSGLGLGGGAGFFFPLGGVSGWVEGRLMHASIDDETTQFFGVMAGVEFPLGGG